MRYDNSRVSLDRHAAYIVSAYIAGAARKTGNSATSTAWQPHRRQAAAGSNW